MLRSGGVEFGFEVVAFLGAGVAFGGQGADLGLGVLGRGGVLRSGGVEFGFEVVAFGGQ